MSEEFEEQSVKSVWERVKAVLRFEHGVFEQIASDDAATRPAFIVFVLSRALGTLWALPLVFVTVPLRLAMAAIGAGLFQLVSRLFSTDRTPYVGWLRAILFCSCPGSLGVIPLLGSVIGGIYEVILQIVAIREVARIPTGAAVITWLIGLLLPGILIGASLVGLGISALGLLGLGELFS